MDSSDSIDQSWDSTSDTKTTAMRSDPMASAEPEPTSNPSGWMVNVAGRDIVEMSHADVVKRWQGGELLGSTLVWREGMENWAKLETIPAFQGLPKLAPAEKDEPSTTEDANPVAVYERPMATLVFDEAVEDEWKAPLKAREPSRSKRASESSQSVRSASARPPAPDLPPLAPRRSQAPVTAVPHDEPPPPPPLPPRKQSGPPPMRRPMPTIPGGLTAPTPRPASVAPAGVAGGGGSAPLVAGAAVKSPIPPAAAQAGAAAGPTSSSSPLLAAIKAAATTPEPVVADPPVPALGTLDEVSFSVRFRAMKSVPLRTAALACVGSALVASLITGLVVGSRSRESARREPEAPPKAAVVATATPSPAPSPAPPPAATTPPAEPEKAEAAAQPPGVEKVALSDLSVSEKPKPKPAKVPVWKPPKVAATTASGLGEGEPLKANPERDDPERAVPDRPTDSAASAQPATLQDPGF